MGDGGSTNCLVGSPFDNSVESESTWIEYWYSVAANTGDTEIFRYDLETAIYHAAIQKMVWCTGGRRVEEAGEEPYYLDRLGRRLGIMAISSAPMDNVMTDIACPQIWLDDDNCFTIQGMLTIMSHSGDDLSMAVEYIRQEIKNAMESGAFLGSQGRIEATGLASITQVTYLGNSEEEVLALSAKDEEVVEDVVIEDDYSPTVSGGIKNVASAQNQDQGNNRVAPIAIGSVVGAACLMLLGILLVKRRKNRHKNQPSESQIVIIQEIGDADTFDVSSILSEGDSNEQTLAGGMTPPDKNEVRAQALAAERQYAMEKGLGTIPEDATYYSDMRSMELVAADASHLGICHSSVDVQPCQSPNCKQCREDGVVFIPRDWQPSDMSQGEDGSI